MALSGTKRVGEEHTDSDFQNKKPRLSTTQPDHRPSASAVTQPKQLPVELIQNITTLAFHDIIQGDYNPFAVIDLALTCKAVYGNVERCVATAMEHQYRVSHERHEAHRHHCAKIHPHVYSRFKFRNDGRFTYKWELSCNGWTADPLKIFWDDQEAVSRLTELKLGLDRAMTWDTANRGRWVAPSLTATAEGSRDGGDCYWDQEQIGS